jgi:membrane protease YdiL (CAAX protease family)
LNGIGQVLFPPPAGVEKLAKLQETVSVWALFVSFAILPAVCEELFYRGLVYRSFASRMKPAMAMALSAALFAAAHLNPYEMLPLFGLGVILALAARSAGTLIAPMIVHFVNNGFTVLMMIAAVKWPDSPAGRLLKSNLSPWGALFFVMAGAGCIIAALRLGASRDRARS